MVAPDPVSQPFEPDSSVPPEVPSEAPPETVETPLVDSLNLAAPQSHLLLTVLLPHLSEGIIACDAAANLILYNAAARRIVAGSRSPHTATDWMADCTLTRPTGQLLPPQDNPLQQALQGESIRDLEVVIIPPNDPPRQVLINSDPLRHPDGACQGAVLRLRDVTQFRQTTQTLREQEDFLRTLYNEIETAIFVVDVLADGSFRYVSINPACERMTGWRSVQIQGQTPAQVLPPETAASVTERYRQCVEYQTPQGYEECLPVAGQASWWLTTLHPLLDQQGQVYRLIGTSLNITRRKQAEEAVRALNAELEQRVADRTRELTQINSALLHSTALLERRNRELDQFVYVASHDLKAPLRAISNLSSWLEEDLGETLPPENRKQLQLLRGRVNRMEALINGLLEYSRVERKQFPKEPVNVRALIADIIDSLAPPATFSLRIDCNLPTFVTKRVLLHQIFANLISNAIKHCDREDGVIQVSCQAQAQAYRFSVTDNGPGIAPEYHEKIFGVFQTLKARDQLESTGIGLSIVKKILDAEGGRVEVDSTPGNGTTFHIYWPKSATATTENPSQA